MEVNGAERRWTQLFDDLWNRRRYWELKEEAEDKKSGNNSFSHEHKEEIQVNLLTNTKTNNKN